jgi:hypothetical protein
VMPSIRTATRPSTDERSGVSAWGGRSGSWFAAICLPVLWVGVAIPAVRPAVADLVAYHRPIRARWDSLTPCAHSRSVPSALPTSTAQATPIGHSGRRSQRFGADFLRL